MSRQTRSLCILIYMLVDSWLTINRRALETGQVHGRDGPGGRVAFFTRNMGRRNVLHVALYIARQYLPLCKSSHEWGGGRGALYQVKYSLGGGIGRGNTVGPIKRCTRENKERGVEGGHDPSVVWCVVLLPLSRKELPLL